MAGEYDAIDLPPVRPVVTRHRRLSCACPSCGARTKAAAPEAASGTPFGPQIATLAFYYKHFHHLSYERLAAMFRDVFGLRLSEGALANLFRREGARFEAEKERHVVQLRAAELVASDETGVRIEGANAQHWVFRSKEAIVHEMAFSRGAQVARDVMAGHRPAFWLSDRYAAQQGHGERHQTCLAHLARDAARVVEVGDERVGLSLKLWIGDAFALAHAMASSALSTIRRKANALDDRIGAIVARPASCEETAKVQRKFARARDQLLTFAHAPPGLVDSTNNGCERELRPSVIARKVTNGFRPKWAADGHAALRTTVSTAALNGVPRFEAISRVIRA
jgi:transposase